MSIPIPPSFTYQQLVDELGSHSLGDADYELDFFQRHIGPGSEITYTQPSEYGTDIPFVSKVVGTVSEVEYPMCKVVSHPSNILFQLTRI